MSDFKVWRIIPLSMVTTCEEERDKWIAAGHEVVELVSIDRIKQLEQELAECKAMIALKDEIIENYMKAVQAQQQSKILSFDENGQLVDKSQAQQPSEFLSCHHFMQMHKYTDSQGDTWTENSLASSAQDFLSSASKAYDEYLQSQAQQESQWQPIATAPKNRKIIVRYKNIYGKDRTVFAKYIEKFTEEAATEYETDYCESDDTYYLKEGWVELIDNWDEFSSVYFDSQNVPTHWMPIPPAPEGGEDDNSKT